MNNLRHPLSQESRQRALRSPKQIGERVRVTAAPIYLLATAVLLMIGAFIVWGFLGVVTDKAYYSGVVFPAQGTVDVILPNKGVVRSMLVHTDVRITAVSPHVEENSMVLIEARLPYHPHLLPGMTVVVTL